MSKYSLYDSSKFTLSVCSPVFPLPLGLFVPFSSVVSLRWTSHWDQYFKTFLPQSIQNVLMLPDGTLGAILPQILMPLKTDKVVGTPIPFVCLLIWVAKHATSHMLQSNKNNNYRWHCNRLIISCAFLSTVVNYNNAILDIVFYDRKSIIRLVTASNFCRNVYREVIKSRKVMRH